MNQYTDQELKLALTAGDRKAYEFLFRKFYQALSRFSLKLVGSEATAEDVVQEVFVALWEKHDQLSIKGELKSYLFAAVRYASINHLRQHQRQINLVPQQTADVIDESASEIPEYLIKKVYQAIEQLPEKCRLIFILSRQGGLTYKEIAEELDISVKTVEAQMGIAFKKIRSFLKTHSNDFVNWVLIICLTLGV